MGKTSDQAALTNSIHQRLWGYIRQMERGKEHRPQICVDCRLMYARVDQHLKNDHNLTGRDLATKLKECISFTKEVQT